MCLRRAAGTQELALRGRFADAAHRHAPKDPKTTKRGSGDGRRFVPTSPVNII